MRPAATVVKPPLTFFVQGGIAHFTGDPLMAGRMLSATAGTFTTILSYFLGRRIGGPVVGLVTATIYAISPIAVLHERMVLQDGPMSAFSLAAALTSWTAIERRSWTLAAGASILGAIAVELKVPGVATAIVSLLLLFISGSTWKDKVGHALLAAAGPVASYVALMISPLGYGLAKQDQSRLQPMDSFWINVGHLRHSAVNYFPTGLAFFVLAGIVLVFWRNRQQGLAFLAVLLVWSAPWLVLSNFAPSRYYLPAIPYVCALAAVALVRLPSIAASFGRIPCGLIAAASATVVLASGIASAQLASSHSTAAMTKLDDWQYRSGWPSGYGYGEAAQFIVATAEPGSAVAYVVDPAHRIAAGFYRRLPQGVTSLGLFNATDQFPTNYSALYVMVDDGRDDVAGQRLKEVLAREPRLRVLVRFTRPGAKTGVSVLRMP